jgi:hypothetical protein
MPKKLTTDIPIVQRSLTVQQVLDRVLEQTPSILNTD